MTGARQPNGEAHRGALLQYLQNFHREHHYMPSIQEMSEAVGLARTAIVWHLEKLRESHQIDYDDGKVARSLRFP